MFSRKLSNLWPSEAFMSSCYYLHICSIAQFEIFIWLSALQRPCILPCPAASTDHTGTSKHSFLKHLVWIWMILDQPLSCSYLHGLKTLKMMFCQFYYNLSFLVLSVLNTQGIRKKIFPKEIVEIQEAYLIFKFIHFQWNIFNEKIKKKGVIFNSTSLEKVDMVYTKIIIKIYIYIYIYMVPFWLPLFIHYDLRKKTKQASFCLFYSNILLYDWYFCGGEVGYSWRILKVVADCILPLKV